MGADGDRRRCLIIEDQALVGMAVESSMEDTGSWTCDLAYSAGHAMRCLEDADYDAAILDYILQDKLCTALAAALSQRGVPFLIYSDYRRPAELPPVLRDAPWIEKLADHRRVLRAWQEVTARPATRPAAPL